MIKPVDQNQQWDVMRARYEQLNTQLLSPDLDVQTRQKVQKEHAFVSTVLKKHDEIENMQSELDAARLQLNDVEDVELKELFVEEVAELEANIARTQVELDDILYPPHELDGCSAFLEIRAGAGGQEAALFAGDLLRMYCNYALKRNWRVSIVSEHLTDLKGFKEVVAHIQGAGVYGQLKYESGVHRVQRVPATESQGRVHTSTVTVAVLPEIHDEVDVDISPADLRIDVYRSGGAGGQHVNTTDSAVRITHIPTGVVVACQDERSQHKNKAKAMSMLKARLLTAQQEKLAADMSEKRRLLIGTGSRSEKVRTYNYPQNRITDHQVDLTLKKLDIVMEGNIDEIIEALVEKDRQMRRQQLQ